MRKGKIKSEKVWIARVTPVLFTIFISILFVLPLELSANTKMRYLKHEGQKYYWGKEVSQDMEKAFKLYLEAANLGDKDAQYIVGGMYFRGMGTQRDFAKAFQLLHSAALNGKSTPESQRLLGEFFLKGYTVPQNYEEAVKWYTKAAGNGDRDAQAELGYLYYSGQGVAQDYTKSFFWFDKAARQGLTTAQYSLGIMWYSGVGAQGSSPITAYAWMSVAATNNHPDAENARDLIIQGLSKDELKQAQNMATTLFDETPHIPKK